MKNIIIIFLVAALAILGFMSLFYATKEYEKEKSKDLTGLHDYTKIIVIDSCEYVIYKRVDGYSGFFWNGS